MLWRILLTTPNALLRIAIAVCSARDALLGIISIYKAGHTYTGQRIQARKCSYSEQGIRSKTCSYIELSEVKHRYPKCTTPNIGTIRSLASYKILLQLEHCQLLCTYNFFYNLMKYITSFVKIRHILIY